MCQYILVWTVSLTRPIKLISLALWILLYYCFDRLLAFDCKTSQACTASRSPEKRYRAIACLILCAKMAGPVDSAVWFVTGDCAWVSGIRVVDSPVNPSLPRTIVIYLRFSSFNKDLRLHLSASTKVCVRSAYQLRHNYGSLDCLTSYIIFVFGSPSEIKVLLHLCIDCSLRVHPVSFVRFFVFSNRALTWMRMFKNLEKLST